MNFRFFCGGLLEIEVVAEDAQVTIHLAHLNSVDVFRLDLYRLAFHCLRVRLSRLGKTLDGVSRAKFAELGKGKPAR